MKVKLDIRKYPIGQQLTVVKCEKCGIYYEPYGKEHKCRKKALHIQEEKAK